MQRHLVRHFLPSAALLCGLIWSSGCGSANHIAIAKAASNDFHQRFNFQQDGSIYDAADPAFQKRLDREALGKLFARIRRKMGACSESNATSYLYNFSTDGNFVDLKYDTKCAAGTLEETFRWHMANNRATLYNYNAQNPLLLTD